MAVTPAWPYPRIVAHRCCGVLAPENTLAALRLSLQLGIAAIECDVRLTHDGVAVLSHDDELGRAVDGTGRISLMTYAELSTLDAGGLFAREYAGERVATLRQAAEFCAGNGIWMNIEIKSGAGRDAETVSRIVDDLVPIYGSGRWDGPAGPLFSSFSLPVLEAMRDVAPRLPRALLLEKAFPSEWPATAAALGVRSVHPDVSSLTPDFVAAAHGAGLGIMVYTLDNPVQAAVLASSGVDAFCTNRPDLVIRGLSGTPVIPAPLTGAV